ncbi:Tubulin beta-2 chain [Chionoecetes opilio]|uniref:Tubulin beta-2 chain n=1 Tax=Chionoecetes opilio TaxID=41210 RepID=A0A8J8WKS4_CHIOP|nr:Tubulin beta-2 chain [Chionoecetes opilio]
MAKKGREAASGGKSWISLSLPTDVVMSYANNPSAKNIYIIAAMSDIVDATSKNGDTDSGKNTLLVSKILEEFPDKKMVTFSVVPSPKVAESYSAILSIHVCPKDATTFAASNSGGARHICFRTLKFSKPDLRRPPRRLIEECSVQLKTGAAALFHSSLFMTSFMASRARGPLSAVFRGHSVASYKVSSFDL